MYKTMYEIVLYQDQYKTIEEIKKRCDEYESIKKYAIILHDKDDKKTHYHLHLHFGRGFDSEQLKTMFDIKDNQISKIKGRWSDAIAYLTHANAPNKYQYDDNDVVANFNIEDDREEAIRKTYIEQLLTQYMSMQIGYDILWSSLNDKEKLQYYKKIKTAIEIRNTNIKMEDNRDMKVYYISGPAGSGKTTFAKFFTKEVLKMSVYISSSSNDPLQDYLGQQCIILDDLRGDSFKFHDLLKLLDNHTNSSAKSRYYNKNVDCKAIIITSTKNINELYDLTNIKEEFRQLVRRIETFMEIKPNGDIYEFTPDDDYISKYGIIQPDKYIKQKYNIKEVLAFYGIAQKTKSYITDMQEEIIKILNIKTK